MTHCTQTKPGWSCIRWSCIREEGHDGPCAAAPTARTVLLGKYGPVTVQPCPHLEGCRALGCSGACGPDRPELRSIARRVHVRRTSPNVLQRFWRWLTA